MGFFFADEARGIWRVEGVREAGGDAGRSRRRSRSPPRLAGPGRSCGASRSRLKDGSPAPKPRSLSSASAAASPCSGTHLMAAAPPGRIALRLDAGLAFGSGEHSSTRGCLRALETLARGWRPRRVLDLGTGSGILAIAAAKLLGATVLGTDIDPWAVRVAAQNARQNRVGTRVRTALAPGWRGRAVRAGAPYDLVFANILARPLCAMARDLAFHLAPGGRAILSGLLAGQARMVLAAHRRQGLVLERMVQGGRMDDAGGSQEASMTVPTEPYATRLAAVRAILAREGVDGLLVPRADEHLGEYVPANAERLAWLTGFTGSAGLAVVLPDRAAVFTDGRYTLQLAEQTSPALFERHHLIDGPPHAWLATAAPGARIGYSPWLHSEECLARLRRGRSKPRAARGEPHRRGVAGSSGAAPRACRAAPLDYAGRSAAEKRAEIAAALRKAGQDAAVLTDPASLAWLLNIRGGDVPYTPLALGFAVVHADGRVTLFMDGEKLGPETRAWLGTEVEIRDPAELPAALAGFGGKRVRVDPAGSPAWFAQTLRGAGAEVVPGSDPCLLPKAAKNATEQDGARAAHARDAVALCRFLAWLDGRQSAARRR